MKLTVIRQVGMVNIDNADIAYSRIEGLYKENLDGVGLQLNDEHCRDAIQVMCDKIADAVRECECTALGG